MKMTYREGLRQALHESLINDSRVFLMGEDVGAYGGSYAVSKGFLSEFGPERIRDTPLSEAGFLGAGIGAALAGLRPIVEIMTVNFSLLALDQIINSAAMIRHMSGGQFTIPLIIRMTTGGGRQLAAQHSNSLEGWYAHIPGLKILTPATVTDARYMLGEALLDNNPILLFEHALLLNQEDECPSKASDYKLFQAAVSRPGSMLSLITYGGMLPKALQAAENLALEGLDIEVIDLRSLRPLDEKTIMTSVKKTKRAVVVDEGWRSGSLSAEISARIMEAGFHYLKAPVMRVCRKEVPIPYAKHLEVAAIPQINDIENAVRGLMS
jgi:pyruvate dehydrogenase E1 component beta subunit